MKDKRYVVGLQDPKNKSCFKDVEETDVRKDAIKLADEIATEEGRPAIVFERGSAEGIIYRTERPSEPEPLSKDKVYKRRLQKRYKSS